MASKAPRTARGTSGGSSSGLSDPETGTHEGIMTLEEEQWVARRTTPVPEGAIEKAKIAYEMDGEKVWGGDLAIAVNLRGGANK